MCCNCEEHSDEAIPIPVCSPCGRLLRFARNDSPLRRLLRGRRDPFTGEGRHDVAREAPDVVARAAEIDHHIVDAAGAQRFELLGNVVRRAEDRGLVAQLAHRRFVMRGEALAGVAAGALGQPVDPRMALVAPLIGRGEVVLVARDMRGGAPQPSRVYKPAPRSSTSALNWATRAMTSSARSYCPSNKL